MAATPADNPETVTIHKPTVLRLHELGLLPTAAAARALLLAYAELSARRANPCTVSATRIARELGADPAAVRVALLRWPQAKREGRNGERRRAWNVTNCYAPQEQPESATPCNPVAQQTVTPTATECNARPLQNVTPERNKLLRPTTEIKERKEKEQGYKETASADAQSRESLSLLFKAKCESDLATGYGMACGRELKPETEEELLAHPHHWRILSAAYHRRIESENPNNYPGAIAFVKRCLHPSTPLPPAEAAT